MSTSMKSLIDPKSKESSKRYIAILLTYFLMLISSVLFIPYEIKTNNLELLKIIIGSFAAIIITAFGSNAYETVKRRENNGKEQHEEVH